MADTEKREDYRLDDPRPEGGATAGRGRRAALAVVCAIAAVAAACAIGCFGFKAANAGLDAKMQPAASEQAQQYNGFTDNAASKKAADGSGAGSSDKSAEREDDGNSAHEHKWKTVYKKVEHKAVYQTVTETHAVCNTCGKEIDRKTAEHAAKTGHTGYTTGVPKNVEKLVTAAYTEKVADYEKCTGCGKTRRIDQ